MSAGLNSLSRFEVNTSFSTVKIEERLKEIEKRIKTWKKIADKENIDISEEDRSLKCIKAEGDMSAVFNLLLIEECRGRICNRIVRKVQNNLRRVPKIEMKNLKQKLENLSEIGRTWMKIADSEGVDISEEKKVWSNLDASSIDQMYELLKSKPLNFLHKCEVIWRRLYVLRSQCFLGVIRKTYTMRIKKIGEGIKSYNWFSEKIAIIDGICHDAFNAMDKFSALQIETVPSNYQKVYDIFLANIQLFAENPEKYEQLADREWLKRQIQQKTIQLIRICKKKQNTALLKDIYSTYQIAMDLLNTKITTENIRAKINHAYDLFAERLSVKNQFGCGFILKPV